MTARFDGQCRNCHGKIRAGVHGISRDGSGWSHADPKVCDAFRDRIRWTEERKHFAKSVVFRNSAYHYITNVLSKYIREDGLSMGLSCDEGYLYTYWSRPATPDEYAEPLRAECVRLARKGLIDSLDAVADRIREIGDRPDRQPNGTRHDHPLHPQDLYGGGCWFVVEEEGCWFVRNNGMDGDNWALNNVRTQGAGAMGWYLPDADMGRMISRIFDMLSSTDLSWIDFVTGTI